MLISMMLIAAEPSNGWQYTQWGMTEEEVKAVAKAGTTPFSHADADRDGSTSKLLTIHNAGDIGFNVIFRFDRDDRLNGVVLLPKSYYDCRQIFDQLSAAYGKPESEHRPLYSMIVRWRVAEIGSIATFSTMETVERVRDKSKPPTCDVEYTPMSDPKRIGF